jgi:hypothetical protein
MKNRALSLKHLVIRALINTPIMLSDKLRGFFYRHPLLMRFSGHSLSAAAAVAAPAASTAAAGKEIKCDRFDCSKCSVCPNTRKIRDLWFVHNKTVMFFMM